MNSTKTKIYRVFLITIALLLSSVVYNLILLPLKLVQGGVSSLATITNYLYSINPAIMIFILSAATLILSYMYLGREMTMGSIYGCIISPIFVELTSPLRDIIIIDTTDVLLVVLFAGILSGIAGGLMYKSGYSSGGYSTIVQILFYKLKIPRAKTNLLLSGATILLGAYFFGLTNALYSIIYIYIQSIVMDRVLLGISQNKAFYIITEKEKEIKEYIMEELKHSVTTFDVKGGFLEDKRRVMLTVIPSREYYRLTEGIKKIDKNAFFVVTDSYQVEGAK